MMLMVDVFKIHPPNKLTPSNNNEYEIRNLILISDIRIFCAEISSVFLRRYPSGLGKVFFFVAEKNSNDMHSK